MVCAPELLRLQVERQPTLNMFHKVTLTRTIIKTTHGLYILQMPPCILHVQPVPVAARSKASVWGLSPAEIVGSNPPVACLSAVSVVCCQVQVSATG